MPTITVPLEEEDLAFLRAYAAAQGTSAEALLAAQVRNLRRHLESPLHPAAAAASGTVPDGIDTEAAYREYLEKKHASGESDRAAGELEQVLVERVAGSFAPLEAD